MRGRGNIENEYILYTKKQIIIGLIIGMIIISSLGIYQATLASDSIVEIRFADDFTFQADMRLQNIYGMNFTYGDSVGNGTTLDFDSVGLYLARSDTSFKQLSYLDRVRFMVKPLAFTDLLEELYRDLFIFRFIGIKPLMAGSINGSYIIPGSSMQVRVPRGYYLYAFSINPTIFPISNLTTFNYSEVMTTMKIVLPFEIPGLFNNPTSELITNYNKAIITIHSANYSAVDDIINRQERADPNIDTPEEVTPVLGYYLDMTLTKEWSWDLFNPNIK